MDNVLDGTCPANHVSFSVSILFLHFIFFSFFNIFFILSILNSINISILFLSFFLIAVLVLFYCCLFLFWFIFVVTCCTMFIISMRQWYAFDFLIIMLIFCLVDFLEGFRSNYVMSSVVYVIVILYFYLSYHLVLKRCISGLPKDQCPFIPKKTLLLARSRYSRSIQYNHTDSPSHDLVKRSPFQFPDGLTPQSQKAVEEAPCEERRLLGTQILNEKGRYADSMLSRFVGNFIMIFSNHTSAQEVSSRGNV